MNQRLIKPGPDASSSDAAAYWMMRKDSGSMDAEERAAFERWRNASVENARALEVIQRLVRRVDGNAEAILAAEFERELLEEAERSTRGAGFNFAMIAASVFLASIAVVIAMFMQDAGAPESVAVETAIGQSRTIILEDGSEAELNTDSHLTISYSKTQRLVTLQSGEAFFSVEKNKSRPFLVRTGNAQISVTGTSFSVSEINGGTAVNVLTGVVDVAPKNGPVATLLAGDMIEISTDGSAGVIMRYDPSIVLAWRSGKARFRGEPLGKVLNSLNRYFETPIELGDQSLANLPVTGEFDVHDRETTVKALTMAFDLDGAEEPARLILRPRQHP